MINAQNFIPKLSNAIADLLVLRAKVMDYQPGPFFKKDIEIFEHEFTLIADEVPDIIDFAGKYRPDPQLGGNRVKELIDLVVELMERFSDLRKQHRKTIYQQSRA